MSKCEVIGVIDRIPDRSRTPYYNMPAWIDSLKKFGVEPTVLGLDEGWRGLINIPRYIRQWLREGKCKSEYLIFSNCYDVIFTAHPDDVAAKWLSSVPCIGAGEDVMFNCEKDFFPPGPLAKHFPDAGSPWRYLNSGMYIGRPASILAMLENMWLDEIHDDHTAQDDLHGGVRKVVNVVDQNWFQVAYALQLVPITLDTRCEVFQCFSNCTWDEFDLTGEKLVNKVTGTTPLIEHFNGGSKNEMMPEFCRRQGLTP